MVKNSYTYTKAQYESLGLSIKYELRENEGYNVRNKEGEALAILKTPQEVEELLEGLIKKSKRNKEKVEVAKFKEKRNGRLEGYMEEIYYLVGYEEISLPQMVDVYLYKDKITFYKAGPIDLLFTIRSDQIKNVRYEEIEEGPKELIVRLSGYSLSMKDIPQVIIIEYISDQVEYTSNQEARNKIVINTGNQKDQKLYETIKSIGIEV